MDIPDELKKANVVYVGVGACSDCGDENVTVYKNDFGWQCYACLLECLGEDTEEN